MLSNNQYSGKEDFEWGFDSNFWEEETDYNQQRTLVPDMVADDNGYITYDSQRGQSTATIAETAQTVPSTSAAPPPFLGRSGSGWTGWGRGEGDAQHGEGGVAACIHFSDQYQEMWKMTVQISNACGLEVAICCLWWIWHLNTSLPMFCWFTVLQHACEWSMTAFFLEKILNIFIHA